MSVIISKPFLTEVLRYLMLQQIAITNQNILPNQGNTNGEILG
jgi:hypothetical protein